MDIYRDYFTREQLLASIAKAPYVPGRAAELFESMALNSTTLALESDPATIGSLPTAVPRGTPSRIETQDKRSVYTFQTNHYRIDGSIHADEVLGMRSSGTTGASELIMQRRDSLIAKMRRGIDLLHESLRVACITTPSNAFGNIPSSQQIALATDATKTRSEILTKIVIPIETALAGIPFSGITAWCDDTFWGKLIENAAIKATWLGWQQANSLRADPRDSVFFGGVMWERYRGTGSVVIPSGEARIFPTGVPQMFLQAFAPADTLDTVGAGSVGTPYYTNFVNRSDNRGWYIEMQTNVVMVCTHPTAVLPITTN